jgi:putative transposase
MAEILCQQSLVFPPQQHGLEAYIRALNLEHSMNRRGNCHENAVAESFLSSLKRERIRPRTYKTREVAR